VRSSTIYICTLYTVHIWIIFRYIAISSPTSFNLAVPPINRHLEFGEAAPEQQKRGSKSSPLLQSSKCRSIALDCSHPRHLRVFKRI
jgi:hypothetical protein